MIIDSEIATDIARKCGEDVADAIYRNMALVAGGQNMALVAYLAAASALGTAGGAFLAIHDACGGDSTGDEEVADALWLELKPMTVRAITRLRAREAQ